MTTFQQSGALGSAGHSDGWFVSTKSRESGHTDFCCPAFLRRFCFSSVFHFVSVCPLCPSLAHFLHPPSLSPRHSGYIHSRVRVWEKKKKRLGRLEIIRCDQDGGSLPWQATAGGREVPGRYKTKSRDTIIPKRDPPLTVNLPRSYPRVSPLRCSELPASQLPWWRVIDKAATAPE